MPSYSVQFVDHIPWNGQVIPHAPKVCGSLEAATAEAIDWSNRRRGGEAKVIMDGQIIAAYREGEVVSAVDLSIEPGIAGQTGINTPQVVQTKRAWH
jgi:hypothetical protein